MEESRESWARERREAEGRRVSARLPEQLLLSPPQLHEMPHTPRLSILFFVFLFFCMESDYLSMSTSSIILEQCAGQTKQLWEDN